MNRMRIVDRGELVHRDRFRAEELINDRWVFLAEFDDEDKAIDWLEKYRNPKVIKEYGSES